MAEPTPQEHMVKTFGDRWVQIFDALEIPKSVEYQPLPGDAPRALILCRGGNVRSAAIAFLLRYKYNVDAIALSLERNTQHTIQMLGYLADHIFIVQEVMRPRLPLGLRGLAVTLEIGEDVWANPLDLDLLRICDRKIKVATKFAPRR